VCRFTKPHQKLRLAAILAGRWHYLFQPVDQEISHNFVPPLRGIAFFLHRVQHRQLCLVWVLQCVAVQAASRNLRLVDETLEEQLPQVRGDEIRFRQVLLNLLFNAVKFTPSGGVTIRASADHAQGFLRIEIEDTGIGVPMERRGSIFEKFVRQDPASLRGIPGSGLGLAIAKRLVEMMHGKIGLEGGSNGHGSIAWFTLPLASHGQPSEAQPA